MRVDIDACVCRETAGNAKSAVAKFRIISDLDPPTVVITRNAGSSGSCTGTNDNAVSFDIAFSEPIIDGNFTILDDIIISDTATIVVGGFNLVNDGYNQNYTLNLTALNNDGGLNITIKSAVASPITDVSGNSMCAE